LSEEVPVETVAPAAAQVTQDTAIPAVAEPEILEEVPLFNGGVIKKIIRQGTGTCPVPGSLVTCHYVGRLKSNGTQFDSSRDRDEPFKFVLGEKQVIRAWDHALGTMRVGELAILDCGSDFCYGAAGSPPLIDEDADLIFEIELLGWEPNAKEIIPGVAKMYLSRGEGWSTPGPGSVCAVKVLGRIGGEDGEVFLDCRDDALLIAIDVPQLPPGLEAAVCTMKKGERAAVWIESELAGDGFEPLRHLVPVPRDAQLYYELELESFESVKEAWEMSPFEKVEEARRLKEAGNDFFRSGQIARALLRYDSAIKLFEYDTDWSAEDKAAMNAIKLPVYNNMATVKVKMGKHKEVVELCNEALKLELPSVKTLYKRAQAEAALGLTDEAVASLQQALALPSVDAAKRAEVERLLKPLLARQAKANAKEKSVWSAAFGNFSL